MRIPVVNFEPILAHTEVEWRENLRELFTRLHFILGPMGARFEAAFARLTGSADAVAVGSGTAAIELCLRDAGITSPKQEVITSALTAPFTGIGVVSAGCRIRFADVDAETLLLDPEDVARRASRRTAAVVPVHLYGNPCDLDKFRGLARDLGAVLVQDACQAHGARWKGRPLTSYGPYAAYSFYPTKNLGALGDGGAVAVRGAAAAKRLRSLRDGGRRGGQVSYVKGINSRLDEMQACYLLAFAGKLAEWNAQRALLASVYDEMLAGLPGVERVKTGPESVHHLYVIRAKRREELRQHLASQGIGTGVHYPVPLHVMPAFREAGLRRGELPNAEKASREVVSLPLWPYMPESAAREVADRIRAWAAGVAGRRTFAGGVSGARTGRR